MRTSHDIACACGAGSEFAFGERRPILEKGGPR
jgi:hypothetical protein